MACSPTSTGMLTPGISDTVGTESIVTVCSEYGSVVYAASHVFCPSLNLVCVGCPPFRMTCWSSAYWTACSGVTSVTSRNVWSSRFLPSAAASQFLARRAAGRFANQRAPAPMPRFSWWTPASASITPPPMTPPAVWRTLRLMSAFPARNRPAGAVIGFDSAAAAIPAVAATLAPRFNVPRRSGFLKTARPAAAAANSPPARWVPPPNAWLRPRLYAALPAALASFPAELTARPGNEFLTSSTAFSNGFRMSGPSSSSVEPSVPSVVPPSVLSVVPSTDATCVRSAIAAETP